MHRFTFLSCALIALAGCGSGDKQPPADTAKPAAQPAQPSPTPLALASLAGKWNGTSKPAAGTDTTPSHFVVTATADTSGWLLTFPGMKPVPAHVKVDGDSLILDAGPYASARRKGMMVTVHGVTHMQNGMMTGTTVAHYKTSKADSVLTLHTEMTKAP